MLALKLAYRNLAGAGLRTWLNVIVLSFSFVFIIWFKGFLEGWNREARRDMIQWEIGGGQFWHEAYDPYDPFTLQDAHGMIPPVFQNEIDQGRLTPMLLAQGTFYPQGRMHSVMLRGIDPDQSILDIPSRLFHEAGESIPVIIGTRMASNHSLDRGDNVTVRWRDVKGAFDAAEAVIVDIFKSNVPGVDAGQMWIPLNRLQTMTGMEGEATLLVIRQNTKIESSHPEWMLKDHRFLLAEIDQIIKTKSMGSSIFYIMLLSLALLAIFDTQVLSIFRRQREIGTDMALGMTRGQVVRLFTVEGTMHAFLAAGLAALYGIPFLYFQAKRGFPMPEGVDDYGLAIAEKIYPVYSAGLVAGTTILVLVAATVVSYLPATKIARMKPTESIKGKIQ
ncbi:MAG TPA: FtsX-like permease family protein [bacterium]|nr:FtsX-like permease family protein [bacterium]